MLFILLIYVLACSSLWYIPKNLIFTWQSCVIIRLNWTRRNIHEKVIAYIMSIFKQKVGGGVWLKALQHAYVYNCLSVPQVRKLTFRIQAFPNVLPFRPGFIVVTFVYSVPFDLLYFNSVIWLYRIFPKVMK